MFSQKDFDDITQLRGKPYVDFRNILSSFMKDDRFSADAKQSFITHMRMIKELLLRKDIHATNDDDLYIALYNLVNNADDPHLKTRHHSSFDVEGRRLVNMFLMLLFLKIKIDKNAFDAIKQYKDPLINHIYRSIKYPNDLELIQVHKNHAGAYVKKSQSEHLLETWRELALEAIDLIADSDLDQIARMEFFGYKYNSRGILKGNIEKAENLSQLYEALYELWKKCTPVMGSGWSSEASPSMALRVMCEELLFLKEPEFAKKVFEQAFHYRIQIKNLIKRVKVIYDMYKEYKAVTDNLPDAAEAVKKFMDHVEDLKSEIDELEIKLKKGKKIPNDLVDKLIKAHNLLVVKGEGETELSKAWKLYKERYSQYMDELENAQLIEREQQKAQLKVLTESNKKARELQVQIKGVRTKGHNILITTESKLLENTMDSLKKIIDDTNGYFNEKWHYLMTPIEIEDLQKNLQTYSERVALLNQQIEKINEKWVHEADRLIKLPKFY